MMFLCRQSKGVHTDEMQLLRDRADYLKKKVMEYEQEIQALRSDLDMLVCMCYVLRVNTLNFNESLIKYIEVFICILYSLSTYFIYRERKHKITVAAMSGVIQNTAEQSVLKRVVTSYFNDSLHNFVTACQLTRDEVYSMENSIMKQLEVS